MHELRKTEIKKCAYLNYVVILPADRAYIYISDANGKMKGKKTTTKKRMPGTAYVFPK